MRFLMLSIALITFVENSAGDAMDEVNEWRRRSGLRPFIEDPAMTQFAQQKARYRAANHLRNGHQGPRPPAGWHEGTGEATANWGWLTCEMESDYTYAGAGVCVGRDGTRYMVLVCRDGSGRALLPRQGAPVHSTSHLTPHPPTVDRPASPAATVVGSSAPLRTAVKKVAATFRCPKCGKMHTR